MRKKHLQKTAAGNIAEMVANKIMLQRLRCESVKRCRFKHLKQPALRINQLQQWLHSGWRKHCRNGSYSNKYGREFKRLRSSNAAKCSKDSCKTHVRNGCKKAAHYSSRGHFGSISCSGCTACGGNTAGMAAI